MNSISPKKKFGQNFLTDSNIASQIVSYISNKNSLTLIEIGPGKGILTGFIKNIHSMNKKYIEIDSDCVNYLKELYGDIQGLEKEIIGRDDEKVKAFRSCQSNNLLFLSHFQDSFTSMMSVRILMGTTMSLLIPKYTRRIR